MIPAMNIVAWSKKAPWSDQRQVEQDLIISRALVQMFSDDFLRQELRFRGGTALNKLHLPKPLRYSEDIDMVRTSDGPMKPVLDRIHDILDPWLGEPAFDRSPIAPGFVYTVEAEDKARIRLKLEINKVEVTALDTLQDIAMEVDNPWFKGSASIPTFSLEEILATKLRALLQRNKGRDLVDIAHSLDIFPKLDTKRIVEMFVKYCEFSQTPIPRNQAEQRMFNKLEQKHFLADVKPLLTAEEAARFDDAAGMAAFDRVFRALVEQIPGKPWALTPDMLKKHGLAEADTSGS
jgi:predicted nucleotidyltransferase component of viral defense system